MWGNTENRALTVLVAPTASVTVTVNGAGAAVPSDTVVNVPASAAPFKLVPGGSVPPVSPYVYGATPPAMSEYVPHTVTQPSSTAHDVVQRPVAVKTGATLIDRVTPAAWPPASSTRTTNKNPPAVPGVPETVPPGDMERPVGSAPPPIDQRYGGVPPDAPTATGE
jgi:hypothetical protein